MPVLVDSPQSRSRNGIRSPASEPIGLTDGLDDDATDQLVAAAHARAGHGTDLLKIMATGGMSTSGSHAAAAQYTLDELRAVTRAGHDRGLPVSAHAHATRGSPTPSRSGLTASSTARSRPPTG